MTFENIDPYWIAMIYVCIGGTLGVVVPYLSKLLDDPDMSFSYTYFVNLVITMVFAAVVLVPDPVPALVGSTIVGLILAGYGLQSVTNLGATRVRKK
jgi:hypothetical protein